MVSRRRVISNEEKIALALARFAPLRFGGGLRPIKDLADDFKREPAVVSRAVASAFREGLVEVHEIDRWQREILRVELVEQQLMQRFTRLQAAMVIEPGPTRVGGREDSRDFQDEIHASLGHAMAQFVASGSMFRDGDVIGLGGGRGVFHFVDAMLRRPILRLKRITLASLTGFNHARHHSSRFRVMRLDADTHVQLFSQCFTQEPRLKLVAHPLVCENAEDLRRAQSRVWLGSSGQTGWAAEPPACAIVGVGALTRGHRFFRAVESDSPDDELFMKPIQRELRELVQICQAYSKEDNCPIGDIANRLFLVAPSPAPKLAEAQLRERLRSVNNLLLTVTDEQLRMVPAIMLIAGTKVKSRAIRTIIEDPHLNVRFLCTDRETAKAILRDD